jgi:hypothetical protein
MIGRQAEREQDAALAAGEVLLVQTPRSPRAQGLP